MFLSVRQPALQTGERGGRVAKWSSPAAFFLLAWLCMPPCMPPALAEGDGESPVDFVCRIIDSSALAQNLPVGFLTRLIWRESNFRTDAASPVGARGIAQFMPATAAERGLANPDNPEAAIPKAAELLADLRQRFGNLGLAAAAYNAGATRVAAWLAGAGELPIETRDYVMIVTRHSVEDWRGVSALRLADDIVFPESCVQYVASVRRAEPSVSANPALWAIWGVQISSGFSKGAAMWNTYASSLNPYLSAAPIQRFYNACVSSPLILAVLACAAVIYFLFAYVRRPIKNIRDELRRNHIHLEAILRGVTGSTTPTISKPTLAVDLRDSLRAERAQRMLDMAKPRPWWRRLVSFDRNHGAPAQLPFEPLGEKGAAEELNGPAPAASTSPEFEAPGAGPMAGPASGAQEKPAPSPADFIPSADAAYRQSPPQAKKTKSRGLRMALIGTGVAGSIVACGAFVVSGSPLNWSFDGAKGEAVAGLASAVDVLKAPLEAITGATEREEERMRDLNAALTQVTTRLDRIERDYGARLDRLGERIDQDPSSRFADIAARLDKLEQKGAAPATPASELGDVEARLDKLEKRTALATQPASQITDIATRLDKLEKREAVAVAPSPNLSDSGAGPDKGDKRGAAAAASPAKPLPPATPKQSTLMAGAEPSVSNEAPRPDSLRPLLRDYRVEDVRNGIAMVHSRYGLQPVAAGGLLPGGGRVLRIERRNGNWFVVTSLGVIAGGPAPH